MAFIISAKRSLAISVIYISQNVTVHMWSSGHTRDHASGVVAIEASCLDITLLSSHTATTSTIRLATETRHLQKRHQYNTSSTPVQPKVALCSQHGSFYHKPAN